MAETGDRFSLRLFGKLSAWLVELSRDVLLNALVRQKRRFAAEQPIKAWGSDITYLRTGQGWLDLAVVLNLFSRRMVGWAMAPTLSQELTLRALRMALHTRRPLPGLIHHSDRGTQYTSQDYQLVLKAHRARPSFGHVGSCFDNAAMESFFDSLKRV